MAYKRVVIVITNAKKDEVNNALFALGFGQDFFTVGCNPSGRKANPATHWACDVFLSSRRIESLIAALKQISGVNPKVYRAKGKEVDRFEKTLEKEGTKPRTRA